jgi:hypothetical protein
MTATYNETIERFRLIRAETMSPQHAAEWRLRDPKSDGILRSLIWSFPTRDAAERQLAAEQDHASDYAKSTYTWSIQDAGEAVTVARAAWF